MLFRSVCGVITATHTELTITTSDVTTDDTGRDTGGAAIAPIIVRTSARDLYLDGGHHSAAIPVRASAGAPGHPRARR